MMYPDLPTNPDIYQEPASVTDFTNRVVEHYQAGERIDPIIFLKDLDFLSQINLKPDSQREIYGILTEIGRQRKSVLAIPLVERVIATVNSGDNAAIAKEVQAIRWLGYDYDPEMGGILKDLSIKYKLAPLLPPHPVDRKGEKGFSRSRRRLVFGGGLAAGLTLLGVGGKVLVDQAKSADTVKFSSGNLFSTPLPVESPPPIDPSLVETPVLPSPTVTESHQLSALQDAVPTGTSTVVPSETASPVPTEKPEPTSTVESTATSTSVPTATETDPKEIVGDKNIAEYFLGDLLNKLIQRRLERVKNDPASAERINKEFLGMNTLNFLYLGIDETRERPNEFSHNVWGRADSIMLISFNPHTFETKVVSFPRDMFAPELKNFHFSGGARINALTMAPYVDRRVDASDLGRRIIESATGLPVDGVIKTNIDFMQGFENHPGIFDKLFPEGLKINVTEHIVDNAYPGPNYDIIPIEFKPGVQTMHGKDLVHYGRSRHADSDFGRSDRQRQIFFSAMENMFPKVIAEFVQGNTDTLDLMANILQDEGIQKDSTSDINIVEVLKTMKQGLINLRNPQGLTTLALLGANSAGLVKDMSKKQTTLGLSRENGSVRNVDPDDPLANGAMLRVNGNGRSLGSYRPDANGTFTSYWSLIRDKVRSLFEK